MCEPKRLSAQELCQHLREYEAKYGYSTATFLERFTAGELGDDDDLLMWAGIHHLYRAAEAGSASRRQADGAHDV